MKEETTNNSSGNAPVTEQQWSKYLKGSKKRFYITLGCFAVAFVPSFILFQEMFYQSDWTTFRNDGSWLFGRWAVFVGMLGAFMMLNILTGIVVANSLFCERFVAKIKPKQLLLKLPKKEGKNNDKNKTDVFSVDNSEHFRTVKLVGEWTHTTRNIIWLPVILLLILTLARIFVFENLGQGEVIRLCYVLVITLLIFYPVMILRAKARNLRHDLIADLRNHLVASQVRVGKESEQLNPEQIKIVIEEIEKYQKGIYSNHFWYPVVSVLLVLSGGVSSPLLLNFFFQ